MNLNFSANPKCVFLFCFLWSVSMSFSFVLIPVVLSDVLNITVVVVWLSREAEQKFFVTQNGKHGVVLQHFHGARAYKVDGLQGVTLPDQEFPRSAEGRLNDEWEWAQASSAGWLKKWQLQKLLVQVHGNVGPQLIWEVLQQLESGYKLKKGGWGKSLN